MDDPFVAIAPFYDWEHEGFRDDVSLYLGFAQHAGGPVLELACGTGRLLEPLAAAGAAVEGVDASEPMLALARARVASAPYHERVKLHHADLTSFSLPRTFPLAFIALDALGLLLDRRSQAKALCRVRDHLVAGGLLIVDVTNGNAKDGVVPGEVRHALTAPHPYAAGVLTKWVAVSTSAAEQTDSFTYFYDHTWPTGQVERTIATLVVRYFYRFELELLLELAGLRVETLYGSYDLEPYTSESARLIAVARKA